MILGASVRRWRCFPAPQLDSQVFFERHSYTVALLFTATVRQSRCFQKESPAHSDIQSAEVGHYELGGLIATNILSALTLYLTRRALHREKTFENIDDRQRSYLSCCMDSWRMYPLFFLVATAVNIFLPLGFCPYLSDAISTILFVAGRLYSFLALVYFTFFINSLIIPHSNWETWLPSHCLSRGALLWIGFLSFTSLYAGETTSRRLTAYLMMSFTALGGFAYFRYKYDKHPLRVRLPEDIDERPVDELVILTIAQVVFCICGVHYQVAIYLSAWINPDLTLALPVSSLAFYAAMETYGKKIIQGATDSPDSAENSDTMRHGEEGNRRVTLNLNNEVYYSASYNAVCDRTPLVGNEEI